MIESYLTERAAVLGVVLLVESRVVTEQDCQTLAWLRTIVHRPILVAIKADKLKASERVRLLRQTHTELGLLEGETLIPYSATTGDGRDRLWGALRELAKT